MLPMLRHLAQDRNSKKNKIKKTMFFEKQSACSEVECIFKDNVELGILNSSILSCFYCFHLYLWIINLYK